MKDPLIENVKLFSLFFSFVNHFIYNNGRESEMKGVKIFLSVFLTFFSLFFFAPFDETKLKHELLNKGI